MSADMGQAPGQPDKDRIIIFDTTLRDGEQSPGASMNMEEKLRIAHVLEEMGVDVIEAGFPVASDGDFEAVRRVAQAITGSSVCGLARAVKGDIGRCFQAIEGARRPRIHTFISTSPLHMKYKLQMEPAAVLDAISSSVGYARSLCEDVEWSAEDASRTEPEFLVEATRRAVEAGARTINFPDTVGYAVPEEYAALFRYVIERLEGADKVIFSTHCHNDLGLAVANSIAALRAGARQVECTINGLGERAGNAAMEEIVMAVRTRGDALPVRSSIKTEHITRASRLVSAITGFPVQPNKAIVGANAFAHESGIHQDGVLKNAQTYEIMTPESVGLNKSNLVMGKHSGRHAFKDKLRQLGVELGDNALNEAFRRFKDLADKKKEVFDEDIIALIEEEERDHERVRLVALEVLAGTVHRPPVAEVTLEIDGVEKSRRIEGDGPVDATFQAIKALFGTDARLQLYQVHAVTAGTDAQGEVTVRLEENGKTVNGQGADTDILVASARAYVNALNKLIVKRAKQAPDSLAG